MDFLKKRYSCEFIKPEYCFLFFALVVGLSFALLIPAGAGSDEPNHIARVASISQGNIAADKITDHLGYTSTLDTEKKDAVLYGGVVDNALTDTAWNNMVKFHTGKESEGGQVRYSFPTWETPGIVNNLTLGKGSHVEAFSNTAVNSPLVYLPFVVGYWFACLFTNNAYAVIVVMRVFGLFFFCAVIFLCIKKIPVGKWILVSISLIPNLVFCASMVTADTVTYAVCITFMTVLLSICSHGRELSKSHWRMLAMSSIALALVKITYQPLMLLIGLILIFNERNRETFIKLISIASSAGLVFLLWYSRISNISSCAIFDVNASPTYQKQFMIAHPFFFIKLLIKQLMDSNFFNLGAFGTIDFHGHWDYCGWITIFILMTAICLKDAREREMKLQEHKSIYAVSNFFVVACVFFLICLAIYLQFNEVGADHISGIQDRYFLPILILMVMPIRLIVVKCTDSERNESSHSSVLWMQILQLGSAVATMYVLFSGLFTSSIYGM